MNPVLIFIVPANRQRRKQLRQLFGSLSRSQSGLSIKIFSAAAMGTAVRCHILV